MATNSTVNSLLGTKSLIDKMAELPSPSLSFTEEQVQEELILEYLKKLAVCNAETDTLEISLDAFRDGHINKEQLDDLTSICPQGCSQVPTVAERRTALLKHIHTTLQGELKQPNTKSEVLALAKQALRERSIKQDVIDHLTSLHPQVPIPMRHRYLLMFMCPSLTKILDYYWKRALEIQPYNDYSGFDPLKLAKVAVKDNLIDKSVLDRLTALYPKISMSVHLDQRFVPKYRPSVKELARKMKLFDGLLPHIASSNKMEDYFPLGPEHLPQLNELLSSYAHKWKEIAIMLKFRSSDLQNIEVSPLLIPTAPKSFLTRLLEEWLQRAQKCTLPPTMGNLRAALNSQSVGLGKLASNFALQTDECGSNKPAYSYFIESSGSIMPVYVDLYLEEGNSTLLEINCFLNSTSKGAVWLKNGIKLAQGGPFLYLNNADIDLDGSKFSCHISASHDCQGYKFLCQDSTLVKAAPITVHVSCPLDKFKASLAAVYLAQPEVPEDTWPPVESKKYINLALIKQEEVNYSTKYVRQTIRGDMDDILQNKETVEYEDLYNSLRSGQLVFIEGRPGCGKTTFVHKVTRDWANKKKCEGSIRLLFLVSLRVLNTFPNPNLSDILKLFSDLKVSQELIEQRDGKGVCFIFDGFDEFSPPDGDNSIVFKIVKKTYLSQSIVIVASRPAAIAKLRKRAHKVVEVIGFLNNQIFEYFDHYPFTSRAKSAELKAYLTSYPNVLHMCYLPIHAVMVAFLFEVKGSVPRTESKMYERFTSFTLIRNLSKDKNIELNNYKDVRSLNEEQKQLFKQICHLALETTLSNKQVLDQDQVHSFFQVQKQGDISLGLITVDRTADLYVFKNIYTFQHLTFQEYLAAYHISTLSKEQQMKLIEEHGDKNHMLVVWKFYCGLVEIDENATVRLILDKANKNFHYSILNAYESQKSLACAELLKTLNYHIKFEDQNLVISDYTAVGYIINSSTSDVSVALSLINIDNMNNEAADALLSEIQHGKLDIRVRRNSIDYEQVTCIKKLLANEKASFTELSITLKDGMKKDFVDSPLADFKYSCNMAKLSITNVSRMLQIGAVPFENLEFLNLSNCIKEFSEIKALVDGLKLSKKLKHLDVSRNAIDSKGARLLAEGLKRCKVLQKVIVCKNNIESSAMTYVLESLKHHYLKVVDHEIILQQVENIERAELMKLLTNQLLSLDIRLLRKKDRLSFCLLSESWKGLRELKVTVSNIDIEPICNCLGRFNLLETLVFRNGIISMTSARLLSDGCKKCPNLKIIDLKINNIIGPSERKYILDNLPHNISVLMPDQLQSEKDD